MPAQRELIVNLVGMPRKLLKMPASIHGGGKGIIQMVIIKIGKITFSKLTALLVGLILVVLFIEVTTICGHNTAH